MILLIKKINVEVSWFFYFLFWLFILNVICLIYIVKILELLKLLVKKNNKMLGGIERW